jgi:4'-phosphopantetheinyl transferase
MTHPAGGITWSSPPASLDLSRSDVHVWRAGLDAPDSMVESLARSLAEDERRRAARFRLARDRRRFTVGRGLLREILARYLDRDPRALRFVASALGKPSLVPESGGEGRAPDLRFNLSHSGEIALCAVALGREVGVDVEQVRADMATDALAERVFSSRELAALRSLEGTARAEAFFRCWTRKEAYVKARGAGLALSLQSFEVSFGPGEPPALLGNVTDPDETQRWTLLELAAGPGYAAALAVEGRELRLRCWQWDEGPRS